MTMQRRTFLKALGIGVGAAKVGFVSAEEALADGEDHNLRQGNVPYRSEHPTLSVGTAPPPNGPYPIGSLYIRHSTNQQYIKTAEGWHAFKTNPIATSKDMIFYVPSGTYVVGGER